MFTVTIQHPHFSAVVHYFIPILNNSRYIFNWLNNLMPYTMVKFDMRLHESWSTTLKSGFFDPFYNKMRPHIIYLRRETKKWLKVNLRVEFFIAAILRSLKTINSCKNMASCRTSSRHLNTMFEMNCFWNFSFIFYSESFL